MPYGIGKARNGMQAEDETMQTLKTSFSPRNASKVARAVVDFVRGILQDGFAMQSKVNLYH